MLGAMEETAEVQCPFCGARCTVTVDVGVASQRFVTDCEVCCRPFEVCVVCEGMEVVSVDVTPE